MDNEKLKPDMPFCSCIQDLFADLPPELRPGAKAGSGQCGPRMARARSCARAALRDNDGKFGTVL